MAEVGNDIFDLPYTSGQDLTNVGPYVFVRKSTTQDQIVYATAANTTSIVGVLQDNPSSAQHCRVRPMGLSKVIAGAAVTYGALITCNGSGHAITVTSGTYALGYARQAAAAAGNRITVWLYDSPFYVRTAP